MNINSKTPMALYKANLELVLRIGALLQESRQRWMQTGATSTNEAMQRTLAETERMLTTSDWSALSSMPGDEFWKSLRAGAGPMQGTIESATRSQAEFSEGLKQAFAEWQQQSADALGGRAAPAPPWAFSDVERGFDATARGAPAASAQEAPKKTRSATKAKARAPAPKSPAATSKGKVKTASTKVSRTTKPRKPTKK